MSPHIQEPKDKKLSVEQKELLLRKRAIEQEQILKDRFEEIEKTLNKQMNAEIESGLGGQ